ncbi:MAG: hypothetical protein GYB67_03390 [Chloroflexi bacterium]|nr:hypothetical protein [Chloroflexota bacterium]
MRSVMTGVTLMILVLLTSLLAPFVAGAQDDDFTCSTPSGFGEEVARAEYVLDLQCQPTLRETIEIRRNDLITITVNLENYYTATGNETAAFNIHFAMDRARVRLRQPDGLEGTIVADTLAALANVPITTSELEYTFIIENLGLRSAVFDLILRPIND